MGLFRANDFLNFKENKFPIKLDIHNSLLLKIIDNLGNMDEVLDMCNEIYKLGISNCLLTPPIMKDYYDIKEEQIIKNTKILQKELNENKIHLKLIPAATYYVDENFYNKILKPESLLAFDGNNFKILIETSLFNDFDLLKLSILRLIKLGYNPILSQTEKYNYIFEDIEKINFLKQNKVKFQVNLSSFLIKSSKNIRENLRFLVEKELIDFFGTNFQNSNQIEEFKAIMQSQLFQLINLKKIENNNVIF